ncbi:platelet-derived growth factor-associated protein, putative [Babesia bigemina]|uniref:Platelet-derived growth factor-associated protein, putative n=1 Tax=Babesia bigemina TaxID=5866 RepID=A0A061D321_BABBI|nr:platelet-derived growth factor-associated protein, putative [Babesia bigemina]CDR94497.1 platelet-derived growth factor-associated protein, putative [Babesia bigemina]|eukprot:XP_012766683.1 platelet-derived growth factor-associated protein, putative [Babesia bigemina]
MQRKRGSSKKYTAKGRSRYVATEEEIIARNAEVAGSGSSEELTDEEAEESQPQVLRPPRRDEPENDDDDSSEEDSSDDSSSSEFEICNPNRSARPIEKTGVVELSRREREELQRQNFERQKMTLMAQGKLKSAQADLARLAEIRKQREAAMARKMEQMSLKGKD